MFTAVAVLLVLIVLNGIFAMSELAMMTAQRSRLHRAAARGSKSASTALALAAEPTRFLSTVQVGITLIGIFSGAFAEDAIASQVQEQIARIDILAPYSDTLALVLVVLAITYVSLVLGELVPKRIALAHPEAVASAIARPLAALARVTALPVRALSASTELVTALMRIRPRSGDDVSEEDVRALIARAASTGVFTRQEYALFKRTMHVGDLTVRDLMVPRTEVVWIEEDAQVESVRVLVGTSPYSHFPVCRGGLDAMVGVVHLKDLITYGLLAGQEFKVAEVARPPVYVPDTMPALRMLDEFQRTRDHVAFVVDEYGGVQGLLTLNDVLTALIGDMGRGGEAMKVRAVQRHDGSWLLDGRLPLTEAVGYLGVHQGAQDEATDARTVAGLVLSLMGHIPEEGQSAEWCGWRLEVVDMDGTRIDQVLATRVAAETP